jgi:hypothetical protein
MRRAAVESRGVGGGAGRGRQWWVDWMLDGDGGSGYRHVTALLPP